MDGFERRNRNSRRCCWFYNGESQDIKIRNESWDGIEAYWTGYQGGGDWYYVVFDPPITPAANETYNYTIRTGSYPQIIHNQTLTNAYGAINCTEFVDANGRTYNNWIPAIRLE